MLTIGICSGGSIRVETVTSLVGNMHSLGQSNQPANLLFQIGGYVDVNRNKIVESAVAQGTTHLMFIDGDMVFPDDAILTLLGHNKDIVGGNYNVRLDPTSKELSGSTVKMKVDSKVVSLTELPEKLFKCFSVATGFMMINTRVFEKLKYPYFEAYEKDGLHHTEDVDFCRKVNEAGLEVWCDPSFKVGHIGNYVY